MEAHSSLLFQGMLTRTPMLACSQERIRRSLTAFPSSLATHHNYRSLRRDRKPGEDLCSFLHSLIDRLGLTEDVSNLSMYFFSSLLVEMCQLLLASL